MALIDIQVPDIGDFDEVAVIELLVKPEDSPVPLFPTTRIHAEAAVDYALA